MISYALTRGGY